MINVVDSIMGSGKTSYIIQMLNDYQDKKYIYITPFLTEVQRIKSNCINFEEPEEYSENGEMLPKLESLHKLIKKGANIVSTHALFKLTTKFTIELLQGHQYTLIIDEALQIVDTVNLKKVICKHY